MTLRSLKMSGQRGALAPTNGPAAVLNLPRQRQIH